MPMLGMPTADSTIALRDKLRRVARYHRWLIIGIGIAFGLGITLLMFIAFGGDPMPVLKYEPHVVVRVVLKILWLTLSLFVTVSVVLLAKELTNVYVAALCGIVAVAPKLDYFFPDQWIGFVCGNVYLILLIVFYVWGLRYLKRYGIPVGLLGADARKIGMRG